MIFETERLVVRDWAQSDGDRVFDIYRRWEVSRWLGSNPKVMPDREAATQAIEWFRQVNEHPTYGIWAAEEQQNGVVAGTVLLNLIPDATGEVEVGWHFHPDAWGRGLATEAGRAAIERGHAAGHDEIYAVVTPGNAASLAVCQRLGMRSLGRSERFYGAEMEVFLI